MGRAIGEVYKNFGSTANNDFTGDTQDAISGTYDTVNRELNPSQGRWLSPDPAGLGVADSTNPQTWNRYTYVGNDPLRYVDPLGLVCSWNIIGSDTFYTGPGGDHPGYWTTYYLYGWNCSNRDRDDQGGGTDTKAANNGKSTADIARCAAKVGNSLSLAALLPEGSNQFLKSALSNDFSTVSDLVTGPAGAPRLDATADVLQGKLTTTAVKAVGAIPVGPDLYKLGVNGAGTTFVEDVVTTPLAEKALGKVAGALLGTAVDIKLAWDATTYAYGVAKCWGQPQ